MAFPKEESSHGQSSLFAVNSPRDGFRYNDLSVGVSSVTSQDEPLRWLYRTRHLIMGSPHDGSKTELGDLASYTDAMALPIPGDGRLRVQAMASGQHR